MKISPFLTPPFGIGAVIVTPFTLTLNKHPSTRSVGAHTLIKSLGLAVSVLLKDFVGIGIRKMSPFFTPPIGYKEENDVSTTK